MTIDKNILSIDSTDDNKNYKAFSEYLEEDTKRKKNLNAREIQEIADDLINEIERKKEIKHLKVKN